MMMIIQDRFVYFHICLFFVFLLRLLPLTLDCLSKLFYHNCFSHHLLPLFIQFLSSIPLTSTSFNFSQVSDPIIFGHCVKVFFKDVFAKHEALFAELGVNINNGKRFTYVKLSGYIIINKRTMLYLFTSHSNT